MVGHSASQTLKEPILSTAVKYISKIATRMKIEAKLHSYSTFQFIVDTL